MYCKERMAYVGGMGDNGGGGGGVGVEGMDEGESLGIV